MHSLQLLQPQLPLATLLGQVGKGQGPFSAGALSEPWGYWLLISAMPVFFRVLFTSSSAMARFQQSLVIVSISFYHPLPVQIIVWFLPAAPRLIPLSLSLFFFWGGGRNTGF